MTGDLPQDFLRLHISPQQQQIDLDLQTAQMLQAQQAGFSFVSANQPKLSVTLVQAKLAKNYGITKMDPYCRIRVGHSVFETQTAVSGAKNPRWNKTVQCIIPPGVDTIYLEIFDERAFTMDDRVAWSHITIPEKVLKSDETSDDWYVLNGKQGDGKEGMVNLVLSYTQVARNPVAQPQPQVIYQPPVVMQPASGQPQPNVMYATPGQPVVMVPGAAPVFYPQQPVVGGQPVTVIQPQQQPVPGQQPPPPQQQQPPVPQGPLYTDEDVKQVKDMFPNTDEDVIKSLLEVNRGNKDLTINNLLQMNS